MAKDEKEKAIIDFLSNFDHDHFDIGILTPTGKMINHYTQSLSNVEKLINYLTYSNAQNANIYFRPSYPHRFILLDDVFNPKPWIKMAHTIVKTSINNYQIWLKLDKDPTSKEQHKAICRYFAERAKADKASAEPTHYGRLIGFYNKKSKYHPDYPHVICVYKSKNTIPIPEVLTAQFSEERSETPRAENVLQLFTPILAKMDNIYEHYKNTVARDKSQSEADYYFAKFCIKKMNLDPRLVEDYIARKRTDKKHNLYYAKLTVSKILQR